MVAGHWELSRRTGALWHGASHAVPPRLSHPDVMPGLHEYAARTAHSKLAAGRRALQPMIRETRR